MRPRTTLTVTVALVALAVGASVAGCDKVAEQSAAERRIIEEQQAIEAYSEKVPEVDGLLKAFQSVWRKANELDDIKALKEAWDAKVVPALKAYVAALQAMPAGSEELRRIHAIVAGAYAETLGVFEGFSAGLTEDNLVARHKKLLEATDAIAKAEERYYAELSKYYAANKVTLTPSDRPASAAPPAGAGGPPPAAPSPTPPSPAGAPADPAGPGAGSAP